MSRYPRQKGTNFIMSDSASRSPGPIGAHVLKHVLFGNVLHARTPGTLGKNDQGDPNANSLSGNTAGPLGTNHDAGSPKVSNGSRHSTHISCLRVADHHSATAGSENANQVLKQLIPELLSKETPQDLSFPLLGKRITRETIVEIADLVSKGRIRVRYINPEEYLVEPGIMARYRNEGHQLIIHVWPPEGLENRSIIFHECIHATFDKNVWKVPWRVQEMAAYIAEGWYVWRHGGSYEGIQPPVQLAINIAKVIYAIYHQETALREYKKNHPLDWKDRVTAALQAAYDRLVGIYKPFYESQGTTKFSDIVDVQGIPIKPDL